MFTHTGHAFAYLYWARVRTLAGAPVSAAAHSDAGEKTALHMVLERGDGDESDESEEEGDEGCRRITTRLVKVLLAGGATVHAIDAAQQTPLYHAVSRRLHEVRHVRSCTAMLFSSSSRTKDCMLSRLHALMTHDAHACPCPWIRTAAPAHALRNACFHGCMLS